MSGKISRSQTDFKYFQEVMKNVGVKLKLNEEPTIYNQESSLIIRDIKKELENHTNYPNNIPEFINGLKYLYFQKEKHLKKVLQPALYENDEFDLQKPQDCLIRVLLGVECLQTEIISLLLNEIQRLYLEEDVQDTIWLRLLLTPLRCLSFIKAPTELNNKLLEIMDVCCREVQFEILAHLPEIIHENDDNVIEKLIQTLNEQPELLAATIECFNYLRLNTQQKERIQDRVLNIISLASSLETFPVVLNFLLNDSHPANIFNVLQRIRTALISVLGAKRNKERDSHQVLTLLELKKFVSISSNIATTWLKIIDNLKSSDDYTPMDLLTLFMLHSINFKQQVEVLIRKKLKNKLINTELVEKTFNILAPQLFVDYLKSILTIANNLQTFPSHDSIYIKFSRELHIHAFTCEQSDMHTRAEVLESIQLWGNKASVALDTLLKLTSKPDALESLRKLSTELTALPDRIDTCTLYEIGKMYDVLGAVLWPDDYDGRPNSHQHAIVISVEKMHRALQTDINYKGLIAAVTLVKHIAKNNGMNVSNDTDGSFLNLSDITDLRARDAASLLKEADNRSKDLDILSWEFFLDELSNMLIVTDILHPQFMSWCLDFYTEQLQTNYILTTPPNPENMEVPLKVLYDINSPDSVNEKIIMNIAGEDMYTLSSELKQPGMYTPSLFRVVRMLHQKQYSGKLDAIDALLGSGIVTVEYDIDLDEFSRQEYFHIAHMVYASINWFRELINAFVGYKEHRINVLKRIKTIIELDKMLIRMTSKTKGLRFKNNSSYFEQSGKRKNKPTSESPPNKKLKTKLTASSSSQAPQKNKAVKMVSIQIPYRDLDTDIIKLLKYNLVFEETNESSLTLDHYNFIMNDLVLKLQTLTSKTESRLTRMVKMVDLIQDLSSHMPHIEKHFTMIINQLGNLLEQCDEIHDAPILFTPESNDIKTACNLTLQVFNLIFSWSGFTEPKNLSLLKDCIRPFTKDKNIQSSQKLMVEFVKNLSEISENILTLPSAVCVINIIENLMKITQDSTELRKKLVFTSGKFLERKFYDNGVIDKGSAANKNIIVLAKAHLDHAKLSVIKDIISWVIDEFNELDDVDNSFKTFRCINKSNFINFFREIFAAFSSTIKRELQGKTNDEHLETWNNVTNMLHALMNILKAQELRGNIKIFLKYSNEILKLFLSDALPIFEISLRTRSATVTEILRTMQLSTRFLNNLCTHSKVQKDDTLLALVPQVRLILETLVYRVKALLAANNVSNVFWMGNLKNKDIHGEEIVSQQSDNEEKGEESDEDVEEDDKQNDSDNEQQDNEVQDTDSEIF